jgi:hypothetical protein
VKINISRSGERNVFPDPVLEREIRDIIEGSEDMESDLALALDAYISDVGLFTDVVITDGSEVLFEGEL